MWKFAFARSPTIFIGTQLSMKTVGDLAVLGSVMKSSSIMSNNIVVMATVLHIMHMSVNVKMCHQFDARRGSRYWS